MISYVVSEEAKNSYINLNLLHKNFDSIDIDALQIVIYQTFEKYTYYSNDFAALNLLLYLLIMIDRKLSGKELDSGQTDFTFTSLQEKAFLSSLGQQTERRFGIAPNGYGYFKLYMLFRTNVNFSLGISGITLENAVDEDVLALTREYVCMIDSLYTVDLSVNTFITPFALHLKNLIFHTRTRRLTKSPVTQVIKSNSSIVFDTTIYIALDLMDCYHFMMNENEIASLAIHIDTEIEGQSINICKIPAILIYPDYHDMASGILNIMMMNFGDQLNLIGPVTDETQYREKLRE